MAGTTMTATSQEGPKPGEEEVLKRNPSTLGRDEADSPPWVIQKYGGTSVGKFLDNICGIAESYVADNRVAIVCSARSGSTKAMGTTNLLLQASREALRPVSSSAGNAGNGGPSANGAAGSLSVDAGGAMSGTVTPMFPKRVGSGFFGDDAATRRQEERADGQDGGDKENGLNGGMSSSISSLASLRLTSGRPERSPSPFTSSRSVAAQQSGQSSSPMGANFEHSAPPSPSPTSSSFPNGQSTPTLRADTPPPTTSSFHHTVDVLRTDHLAAARKAVKDSELLDELEREIERDCEGLRSFLTAAQIIDEISPRSQDSIVGIGEKLACKIVAAALRDRGIDSELVLLENVVDSAFSSLDDTTSSSSDQGAATLPQAFYDNLAARLGERILACGDRVPVITGYFGVVPGSLLNQIGRGYTDLCAALCAVGVRAAELQVWKEVDGIFTADPRKVPTARLVPVITPDEAAELTYYGSEVIHPFTMEQVIRARIPIRIKNVENPGGMGTVIYPAPSRGLEGSPSSSDDEREAISSAEKAKALARVPKPSNAAGKLPTAVTIKDSIMVLNIHSNRKTISHGFLARIFGTLDRAGVVVDLISTSEVHVSMAMQDHMSKKALDRLTRDLEKIGHISISRNMAILSLVGRQMRHEVGIAGKMFSTLAEGKINIEMISQGASEINISCVIENKDSIKALNLIHQACLTAPAAARVLGGW